MYSHSLEYLLPKIINKNVFLCIISIMIVPECIPETSSNFITSPCVILSERTTTRQTTKLNVNYSRFSKCLTNENLKKKKKGLQLNYFSN